jgi:tetratricopeptide (TPR) repeat protein
MGDIFDSLKPMGGIRVFISSTFRDFKKERNYLVKNIFPQLRKLCEERGLTWGEVDLRWGITDEQKAEGKVLRICLAEIYNCRPYFIGILGERYGYIPEKNSDFLINKEKWLEDFKGRSVTELEIIHGVLKNPPMEGHAYFYFRDPNAVNFFPIKEKSIYLEESEKRRELLSNLKVRIQKSGVPIRYFETPEQLGEAVLKDIGIIIGQSSGPQLPSDRETSEHEAFAVSRFSSYCPRKEHYDRLWDHINGDDNKPFVILGESGSGKSALLANFYHNYKQKHEDVIIHFIGSTRRSADWTHMLRRIMAILIRKFDIDKEIPAEPSELGVAFANLLLSVSTRKRMVIILDALNQLDDKNSAPDLVWLPPEIPSRIRLIVSTLPGRSLDALKKRHCSTLRLQPLYERERKEILGLYLRQYGKALHPTQARNIVHSGMTKNPLYLRVVLEELRVDAEHETLNHQIEFYLCSRTLDELYAKVLKRCERDYSKDKSDLVRDSLSLIWASRIGISESQLMDLLGERNEPLPRAHWSPFYLAMENSFSRHSGTINFFHDYLRRSVEKRYLNSAKKKRTTHMRLATYFQNRDIDPKYRVEDIAWQLAQAKDWKRLYALLSDMKFFSPLWSQAKFDVERYWAEIQKVSRFRMLKAYKNIINNPRPHIVYLHNIARLLSDFGHKKESARLYEYLIKYYGRKSDRNNQAEVMNRLLDILVFQGDNEKTIKLVKMCARICKEAPPLNKQLADCLLAEALVYQNRGELIKSAKLLKQAKKLFEQEKDKNGQATCFNDWAVIVHNRGKMKKAILKYEKARNLWLEISDLESVQIADGNIAFALYDLGHLDKAMTLLLENKRVYAQLGNLDGLRYTIGCEAMIYYQKGEIKKAAKLFEESYLLSCKLKQKEWQGFCYGFQARIKNHMNDMDGALMLLRKEENIYKEIEEMDYMGHCLVDQACILMRKGEFGKAEKTLAKSEQMCREFGYKLDLISTLAQKALLLTKTNHYEMAKAALLEAESESRKAEYPFGLAKSLAVKAVLMIKEKRASREISETIDQSLGIAEKHGLVMLRKEVENIIKYSKIK